MKKIRVGITGATGFIGRHLIKELLAKNYQVTAFCYEKKPNLPKSVKIIFGDLRIGRGLSKFLKNCNVLIHLAARILPPEEKMYEDNVVATENLLNAAEKFSIKKIIFMSSVAVYGESKGKIFKETDKCKPNTKYGQTKYLAEKIIRQWAKKNKRGFLIFRPFNIYGPGNFKGVIYNFYDSIRKSDSINIYGTGKQKRNFLFVDDVVGVIILCLERNISGTFNLGSRKNVSLLDLVRLFEKILKRKVIINFLPKEGEKLVEVRYSSDLVTRTLGWTAKIGFSQGLKKTINWYKKISKNLYL